MSAVLKNRLSLPLVALATTLLVDSSPSVADPEPFAVPPVDLVYPAVESHLFAKHDIPGSELTERGRDLRGVYLPIGRLRKRSARQLAFWVVNNIGADAVMIDIKDDRGRITFTREIPDASGPVHGYIKKIPTLVKELKKSGVYVIGRLVCIKDNFFSRAHPDAAMYDQKTKKLWRDRNGLTWLDPYSPKVHDYIAEVARAAERFGFDEIQLDYIRFPVEPGARRARFPSRKENEPRHEALAALLATVDRAIRLPLSIDVFGLTAYHPGDQDGLGQSLEHLAPHIDAISPMLYLANWPRSAWENPKPSRTHRLVHDAVLKIRERLGDHIAVRPLLQAFRYRAENFGSGFILNQIDAAETAGSSGYLFWNQSGNYSKVAEVWERMEDEDTPALSRREESDRAP
jgi:hypothetical protein